MASIRSRDVVGNMKIERLLVNRMIHKYWGRLSSENVVEEVAERFCQKLFSGHVDEAYGRQMWLTFCENENLTNDAQEICERPNPQIGATLSSEHSHGA